MPHRSHATRAASLLSCVLLAGVATPAVLANDNGVGRTPPMGWRNWNFFQGAITQKIMQEQMAAMTARTRSVVGRPGLSSLLDVGYTRAGLDDNWQSCGAGIHGPGSKSGSFHNASGMPLINTSRFPDMRGMVDYGHARGLKVGWYDNNCICGEGSARLTPAMVERDTRGNVRYLAEMGFDGLKADGCGAARNMTELSLLCNATARPILLENCHYNKVGRGESMPKGALPDGKGRIFPYWENNITGGRLVCPENTFRTSGDIRNSWGSWFGNLNTLTPFLDAVHPVSQPGCWAYADMLMVGVFASSYAPSAGRAASVTEWRSHFGAWAVVSSPLILSFDLTNTTTMGRVWPFISNLEAIAVNQAWAGHPGRRVFANSSLQVWAKPMPHQAYAALVVNMGTSDNVSFDLDIGLLSGDLPPDAAARDIWAHKDVGTATGHMFSIQNLAPHDSRFLFFHP